MTRRRHRRNVPPSRRPLSDYLRLHGRYELEVIDGFQQPGLLADSQIIVMPTLINRLPRRWLVGELSDEERVLIRLNFRPGCANDAGLSLDVPGVDPGH
jgi:KaiB domain